MTSGGIQPRTVVLIAGATITVGAAALGIGFASKVSSESEQLSSVTSQLPLPPGASPSGACANPTDTAADDLVRSGSRVTTRGSARIAGSPTSPSSQPLVSGWRRQRRSFCGVQRTAMSRSLRSYRRMWRGSSGRAPFEGVNPRTIEGARGCHTHLRTDEIRSDTSKRRNFDGALSIGEPAATSLRYTVVKRALASERDIVGMVGESTKGIGGALNFRYLRQHVRALWLLSFIVAGSSACGSDSVDCAITSTCVGSELPGQGDASPDRSVSSDGSLKNDVSADGALRRCVGRCTPDCSMNKGETRKATPMRPSTEATADAVK